MPSENTKRIARNTGALYFRLLLSMAVTFYTSRVVLNVLGVEDYGIYNVVGGIVALFGFLQATMSGAILRFLTYELGQGNEQRLKETFSTAVLIHVGIAVVFFIIAETIGLWFLNTQLSIPAERMFAAGCVYQLSIISTMLSITQAPYYASIIAHEKITVYAYIEILNVTLKLLIVYLLTIGGYDKLILYAVLVLCVYAIITAVQRGYCLRHFQECRFHFVFNRKIFKPLLSFSGWELYGNTGAIVETQGVNMLLNIFFGTVANAAAAVANQVQFAVGSFASNIVTAVRPQIVKSYASGDINYMIRLIYSSARFMYLLVLLLSLPILLDTHFVLSLWLKTVPEYTVRFCQFALLYSCFANMSSVIMAGIQATGNIKYANIANGTLFLSIVPLTYLIFKFDGSPYVPYACNALFVFMGCLINLYILKRLIREVSLRYFLSHVLWSCFWVTVLSALIPICIKLSMEESWQRFLLIGTTSVVSTALFSYSLAFTKQERNYLLDMVRRRLHLETEE